ncbi:hypothetical protein CHLRE_06g268228v5 [Chlamydomonas reinhardtii]|uniref:Protein kinase domain-containing protein n=1 Tax=Chlamydomonas reinhardtii TaxID=3055 RepID=A0A2K3DN48_CHLRE|nr:uncharacterized protein CHLRE_06g268228v5 [Chlamydomonas reinhardtii]PNW81964.1 hypothetical protein CHLRE_06g268228v5 [Chlamydomonas reinhardtii]
MPTGYALPDNVLCWRFAQGDPADDDDNHDGVGGRYPLGEEDVATLTSEAAVQTAFSGYICKRVLEHLAQRSSHLQPGWHAIWEQDSNSSTRLRPDLVLVLRRGGREPSRPALLVEVKHLAALMVVTPGAPPEGEPVDLVESYKLEMRGLPTHGQRVQPMLAKVSIVFTKLLALGLCHGVLTCWGAAWLVHVPAWNRRRMYVSRPFLATDAGSVTLLRALSWLQQQALQFALSAEYPAPPQRLQQKRRRCSNGGGSGGGRVLPGDGAQDVTSLDLQAKRSCGPPLPRAAEADADAGGGAPAAAGESSGGSGPASGPATAAAPEQAAVAQLLFDAVLSHGRDGTVFVGEFCLRGGAAGGTCWQRVAIKAYCCWEPVQATAYAREVGAYRALSQLQGYWVPRKARDGLVRLAQSSDSRARDRRRLEKLPDRRPCSSTCHGDIRLENILLVVNSSSGGGGGGSSGEGVGQQAAQQEEAQVGEVLRCVLLDFGGSRLDGTPREQEMEVAQLALLLGNRRLVGKQADR